MMTPQDAQRLRHHAPPPPPAPFTPRRRRDASATLAGGAACSVLRCLRRHIYVYKGYESYMRAVTMAEDTCYMIKMFC